MTLPQETEELIESVYGEEESSTEDLPQAVVTALAKARQRMEVGERKEVHEALNRLVPAPHDERLLSQRNPMLEEESPELHKAFQALTRLGPRRLPLVCLHRTAAGLTLEPDGSGPAVDLAQTPAPELAKRLAWYALHVTHRPVVQYLLAQQVPPGWRNHPLLHNHRAVIFTNGLCPLAGTPYTLRLSRERGLEIEREVA